MLDYGLRPGTGSDFMLYSLDDGTLQAFLEAEHNEEAGRLSPDGRWIAYSSDESGRLEVYVRAFPGPGGKWQVSKDGGALPAWRADGRELFYRDDKGLFAVAVETEGAFRHDTPVRLFDLDPSVTSEGNHDYEVSADGQRFLVLEATKDEGAAGGTTTLVQGWRQLLD